jgi:hypothetical protein
MSEKSEFELGGIALPLKKRYRTPGSAKSTSYHPRAGNSNKGRARKRAARIFSPPMPRGGRI